MRCVEARVAKPVDVCRRAHGRELNAGGAGLEGPVHEAAIEVGQPEERREPERPRVVEEPERVALRELRVLEVDDREVESAGRHFDHLDGRQLEEGPTEPVAVPERLAHA